MKRIQFSVAYDDRFVHPLHRRIVAASDVSRAELLLWSPTGDATTLFWCDGDRDATERVVADVDSLVTATFVPERNGTYAFLSQDDYELAGPILDAVAGSDVLFRPPVVFRDTGAVRFEAVGETAALSAFHDDLAELGTLTVERVHEFERARSPSGLTDRQRAALDAAVAVGYYEIPRSGTIADVAAELDCSTSTAGELVRKAESSVVREFTETE